MKLTLSIGDVIYIVARDRCVIYGAIADLAAFGLQCVRKVGTGPWQAKRLGRNVPITLDYATPASNDNAYYYLEYPSGSNARPPHPGTSRHFPYSNGAGEHDTIFLRLEVAGVC